MIKLIIFDLDGVLVTTKQLHYESLNAAIKDIDPKYVISYEDHLKYYDGLPTKKKLKMLTARTGLSEALHDTLSKAKQKYTFDLIRKTIPYDERLVSVFKKLKDDGYKVYVASNSIRETTKLLLYKCGVIEYVDYFVSNEDVKNAKPNAEMYLTCMTHSGTNPKETLIIEDSPVGIEGATNSCGHLIIVKNPQEVTYEKINKKLMALENGKKKMLALDNLNVLIPMEGEGSRFKSAGYTFPKPLIEVNSKPMIQVVIESLGIKANYIYVVKKEHYDKYNMQYMLNLLTPGCKIVTSENKKYSGATGAVLCAQELIDNDAPLLIANSDQYIEWNPVEFYYKMSESKADGGILTFENTHPKWT
jgi:HAD superfamily hydrolase (TIGR01509 family)